MNIEELKTILNNHKLWLNDSTKGCKADLSRANLRWADLNEADLSRANLSWVDLHEADLRGANLNWANLHEANLYEANLHEADLSRANLRWANLRGADLRWADLRGADLSRADLRGANLSEANLWNTIGNSNEIITIQTQEYIINYTNQIIQIGCENHNIKDWFEFDDKIILEMGGKKALTFWRKWKPILQQIIGA